MEREGSEHRHDGNDPVRPRILSPEQDGAIEQDLDGAQRQGGLEWQQLERQDVAGCIRDRFGASYSRKRPGDRFGFLVRKSPNHLYDSTTPGRQCS